MNQTLDERGADQARFITEFGAGVACPNCTHPVVGHPPTPCVLAVFISILRDRGELTEYEILVRHKDCNADAMWDDVGPAIDRLGAGKYST